MTRTATVRKTRVYVAGPYTQGDPAVNVRNAIQAGDDLMTAGYAVFIPHLSHFQHLLFPGPYQDWIDHDNEWVPACDAVLRLPGDSPGADKEVELAEHLGLPVFGSVKELCAYVNGETME